MSIRQVREFLIKEYLQRLNPNKIAWLRLNIRSDEDGQAVIFMPERQLWQLQPGPITVEWADFLRMAIKNPSQIIYKKRGANSIVRVSAAQIFATRRRLRMDPACVEKLWAAVERSLELIPEDATLTLANIFTGHAVNLRRGHTIAEARAQIGTFDWIKARWPAQGLVWDNAVTRECDIPAGILNWRVNPDIETDSAKCGQAPPPTSSSLDGCWHFSKYCVNSDGTVGWDPASRQLCDPQAQYSAHKRAGSTFDWSNLRTFGPAWRQFLRKLAPPDTFYVHATSISVGQTGQVSYLDSGWQIVPTINSNPGYNLEFYQMGTVMPGDDEGHANFILVDNKRFLVQHFDPWGKRANYPPLRNLRHIFLSELYPGYSWLEPVDACPYTGPQLTSDDRVGYCAAWVYWMAAQLARGSTIHEVMMYINSMPAEKQRKIIMEFVADFYQFHNTTLLDKPPAAARN